MKKRTGSSKKSAAVCALLIVLGVVWLLFAGSCAANETTNASSACPVPDYGKVRGSVEELAQKLEDAGEVVGTYGADSALIEALEEEMAENFGAPISARLLSYIFAKDAVTGSFDCEVFFFESPEDAQKLASYLYDSDAFVPGESELRLSGTVVYMGAVKTLELLEN